MRIEVEIESLAYGGAGVARYEGRIVFVAGTAPGDRAVAEVRADRGSFLEAELVEVLRPSPERVEPPCPIVGDCGGCPWQHVAAETQLAAKQRAVVEALRRIGGVDEPPVEQIVASPHDFGYRNRLNLRFEHGRIGFYQARTRRLVPVPDCLLAEARVRDAIGEVERFVASLATRVLRVEIASRGELPGVVVVLQSAGRLRHADTLAAREFVERGSRAVAGLVMKGRGWSREWGDPRRRFQVADGVVVEFAGAAFGQVNTEANRVLVSTAMRECKSTPFGLAVELYAGAGNFSLPLAAGGARVIAVETDSRAVEAGRESARRAGLRHLRFVVDRVEQWLAAATAVAPDLVLLDPPRSGLGGCANDLARLRAPKIVYVSCDPTTLARDVRVLASAGYELRRVVPIDMFPQTFHVESVCTLELT